MSGPKETAYVSPWAQLNILQQIECVSSCISYLSMTNELVMQLIHNLDEVNNIIDQEKLLSRRMERDPEKINQLQSKSKEVDSQIVFLQEQMKINKVDGKTNITASDSILEERRKQLECIKEIHDRAKRESIALKKVVDNNAISNEAKIQFQNEVDNILSESDFSFEILDCVNNDNEKDDLIYKKRISIEKLTSIIKSNSFCSDSKRKIVNAISEIENKKSLNELKTYESITLKPLLRSLNDEIVENKAKEEEYNMLIQKYKSMCDMLGMNEQTFQVKDLELLKESVNSLEEQLVARYEQEYIANCVDEVMEEMGYNLLGSREVTKRNGKHFRNELFEFDEGTAVNITYSSNGQIAMELGGLSREDRIPTEDECIKLENDMETFCEKFELIEKKLAEKNVFIGNRIALYPPAREYAAIINVNDYSLENDKAIKEISTEKRKTVRDSKKYMNRSE